MQMSRLELQSHLVNIRIRTTPQGGRRKEIRKKADIIEPPYQPWALGTEREKSALVTATISQVLLLVIKHIPY